MIIRRDVFLQHPFDERIRRNGGCYFLFNQLRSAGIRVDYEPNARTSHGFPGGAVTIRKHFDRGTALYALSAFAVNRVFAVIEKRMRIPGFIVAGTGGGGH